MTSRLVTNEPKKGAYETFKEVEQTLSALEEGEKISGWCWFEQCSFCCYCCRETGLDDEVQCALVNYTQNPQSSPQGRNLKKIAVPSQNSEDYKEEQELYFSEKRKQLLNRTFSDTSISKSASTNTFRSFEAENESLPSKELQDSNDSTLDKAVENNKIVVQNVLREWEDVLKYRVVTLLDESESTFSAVDSEEEPLELEEIVNDTEEKQEKFGKVEENICNVQDEVNFDYQQEINECSFKTDSSVNISDKKMDKEYEYQREATWFNPNIEDKTTFENEEMELHSNTDIILDQILETLVSHGVELEFQLRSHIEKIHQKISKENSTENNETQATSDTAHGSDQSVQEKLTNDILNGTEQLIPQTPNDIEEIIYEVEELLVTASNEKDELKYQITIDAIDIQETILHKQEEVGLEDLKISELQFTNSGEEVVLTSSMAGVQLTYDISSDLKPSKSGNTTSSNKIEEEFNDKHFIDENIELQATIEDGKVQKISLTGIEIKEERFEDTTDISNGLEIQISKEIKEEMEEKQDDVQTSGVVPKIIEGELKGQLSGSASGELQDSSFKSKGSKTLVRRIVHSFSPIIKCKSTNSKEEEPLLLQKEMIKSDVMSTNGPPETDKQEKNYLPNLDEFHVILETMSTVCAVQPSTTFTKNLEDEELIPEEGIDGQNEQKYIVEVNPVQEKESSKPTITISSTISKSVPEISKSSEDGNNKLPLPHKDEAGVSEAHSSPMLASPRNGTRSATTSPLTPGSKRVGHDWHHEEDLDRIVGLHGRASLSTLGARSDSMASVYSGAGEGRYGSVAVRGQVEFGLQYNYKAGALEIQIKQCKDLAPVDTKRNRSDPYVKVYLLPDKSKSGKRKTKVKKHTLNPVFDECLKFHISLNGLESRTLWLTVWHSDMFGRNDFLGEVMMTLENKVFDDPTPKWYNLQERTEPFEDVPSYRGDVIVCLKFVPPDMTIQKKGKRSRGALHVLIKEAKALTAVKANGTSDPFCKSYLLPDKGRSSKQKTPIARRTTNPVWNYTFVYDDVSLQELAERCLELTVWDHDRLASNEFLGGVRFSLGTGKHYGKPVDWMDASGREMSLWKNMLEKPNFWVEGSLSLRSSLESRGS